MDHPPKARGNAAGLSKAHLHLCFGWWQLLVFLSLGIALEVMHGFKVGWYLDADHETRRLMRDIGFNVRIIPRDTDMSRFWTEGYSEHTMPEDSVDGTDDMTISPNVIAVDIPSRPAMPRPSHGAAISVSTAAVRKAPTNRPSAAWSQVITAGLVSHQSSRSASIRIGAFVFVNPTRNGHSSSERLSIYITPLERIGPV